MNDHIRNARTIYKKAMNDPTTFSRKCEITVEWDWAARAAKCVGLDHDVHAIRLAEEWLLRDAPDAQFIDHIRQGKET